MWLAAIPGPVAADQGPRFDLVLQEAEVHATIRFIADGADLDIVVPDTVEGTVSIQLRHVTWMEALAAVMAVEGLGVASAGDALVISQVTQRAVAAGSR